MPATVYVMPRPEGRRPTPPARAWADVLDDRWTVARVRQALTAHINGVFVESAMLVDAMLGDDRIGADVRTRVLAVTGLPFRLEPSTLGDQRRAKAVAKEAERAWPRMAPLALRHDLARWGVLLGFATATAEWSTTARRWTPSAELFHPQHVDLDTIGGGLRASTTAGLVPVTPGDGSWLVHAPDGSRPWMTAAVRGLALPWLARQYARRDWSRHSEKHGLPIVGAVVPFEADAPEKDAFFDDLRRLGSEGLVMLPRDREGRGFDVKYLEPGNVAAADGFKGLLAHADQAIAVALLGQANNATEGGSYAKAQALDAIRQDLLEADAAGLAETLYAQILRPWAWFNFGDADLAPRPVWDATPPTDTSALAATHKTAGEALTAWTQAASAAGLTVDVEAMAARYGVPLKRAPEPPQPPAAEPPPADTGDAPDAPEDPAEDDEEPPPDGALVALVAGVDLTPPQGVRDACARGLDLHAEGYGGDGLRPATVRWARRLARGGDVTPAKARKMVAWFARHESSPGEAEARRTDKTSPAWVAWLLWGGDAGRTWAEKVVRQLEAAGLSSAALAGEPPRSQPYLDVVVARGAGAGVRAMRPTLASLAAVIDGADSPEALRAGLLAMLSDAAPDALTAALEKAQTLARLAGRFDVLDEL